MVSELAAILGAEATVDDLYRVPGKHRLVSGRLMLLMPTGGVPGHAGGEIFAALRDHARRTWSAMRLLIMSVS